MDRSVQFTVRRQSRPASAQGAQVPELVRFTRRVGDSIYDLAVTWDTESFEGGTPRVAISASVAPAADPQDTTSLFAAVTLEGGDVGSPDLVVRIQDREALRVPLEDLVDESIIDRIPGSFFGVGNPIVGCLVRGGLSAAIGQILRCRRQTRDQPWYRPRIRAIGHCLRLSVGRMAVGMVVRAARCIVF